MLPTQLLKKNNSVLIRIQDSLISRSHFVPHKAEDDLITYLIHLLWIKC